MKEVQNTNHIAETQEVPLRDQIDKYLIYWPWFLISIIFSVLVSVIYLRYATPIYQTVATILIKDVKNSDLSELAAFQDLGFFGSLSQSGFENEMQILKSKSLTERVVRELDLNVSYYSEGNVKSAELYGNLPFRVSVLTPADSLRFPSFPFYVLPISNNEFELWEEDGERKTYKFGESIQLNVGKITLVPTAGGIHRVLGEEGPSNPIKVYIGSIPATVAAYRQSIQMDQMSQVSSVIQLTLKSANSRKAEAILNELIRQYNEDAKEDRNMVARNTAEFIATRLNIITKELDSVESGKVQFKEENKLTDIAVEGQIFLQNESEFNKRQMEVEMQLELVRTMIDFVKNGDHSELLPSNLGIEREGVASAVNSYNQLVLERNRLLSASTPQNPVVVTLDEQINAVRYTVLESLNNAKISLEIARNDIAAQDARVSSKISSIPSKEKAFRSITRQQDIKEALYLYLLQKREENAISLAVTTPKAKIVDYAYTDSSPVSPKRNIILLGGLLVGFLIPFGFIYVRDLLDNKIRSRAQILKYQNEVPVVGEIPQIDKTTSTIVEKNDRSVLAESFRILRTNLEYLLVKKPDEDEGNIIFVTSTVKGEGKTLVSYNLALTLANFGSKVVLVGADIRNPKLQRYSREDGYTKGVVEFLVHESSDVEDYLTQSGQSENLQILFSGTIPPNPAELWMRPHAKELFSQLKERFDYVVVDSAPCMLVTDTFLINNHADVTLYVLRAGHTEKRLLDFPLENLKNKKLRNVAFVLNGVSDANYGYGNKYSYTYDASKKTLWYRIKRAFS